MLHTGRHFLQIPGPTNVPDRILRAMDRAVIDHRSAEFASLGTEVLEGIAPNFSNRRPRRHLSWFRLGRLGSGDC